MNYENDTLIELAKKIRLRSMFLVVMKFSQPQTLPYRTLIFPEKNLYLIEYLSKIFTVKIALKIINL